MVHSLFSLIFLLADRVDLKSIVVCEDIWRNLLSLCPCVMSSPLVILVPIRYIITLPIWIPLVVPSHLLFLRKLRTGKLLFIKLTVILKKTAIVEVDVSIIITLKLAAHPFLQVSTAHPSI